MSAEYTVTLLCEACRAEWTTWGIPWEDPPADAAPAGDWLLGVTRCPRCRSEAFAMIRQQRSLNPTAATDDNQGHGSPRGEAGNGPERAE